jgi:tetratricopeptide (TPR) repeat protein
MGLFNWFEKTVATPEKLVDTHAPAKADAVVAKSASETQSINPKNQGDIFLDQGRLDDAAACYRQAIEKDSKDVDARINLGFVLSEQKQNEAAEHILKQALAINPALPDAWFILGVTAKAQGNLSGAIQNFTRALDLKPDFEIIYGDLCQLLFQSGQSDRAREIILKGIARYPKNAEFYVCLGKLCSAGKDTNQAIQCFRSALALLPASAQIHFILGDELVGEGSADEGVEHYRSALSLNPECAEAHNNLGVALRGQGKLEAAAECYRRALLLKPELAETQNNLGILLQGQGELVAACECYQKAVSLKPGFLEAHRNLGNALLAQGDSDGAIEIFRKALTLKPDSPETHFSLGNAFKEQGNSEAAIQSYRRALSLKPDYAEAYLNHGAVLQKQGLFKEAVDNYKKALSFNPVYAEAYCNLGNAMRYLGELDEALINYRRSLEINPNLVEAHCNQGVVLADLGRYDEALASYEASLQLQADYARAHMYESLARLVLADFALGWKKYEWRWKVDGKKEWRHFDAPLWLGKESLCGKTILLHAEQGYGDTIQFCRYAKLVAGKGAKVFLEVQSGLEILLSGLAGVSQIVVKGEPLPLFDYHCPLLSLPLAFGTGLNSIPADVSYLVSDPVRVSAWRIKLGKQNKLRVGFVWSGNRAHKNDRNRSVALSTLVRLMPDQLQCVCLQKEVSEGDRRIAETEGGMLVFDNELTDFAETAALVSLMDLVVAVDTSVAHLAGAMGKPVWLLLPFDPDWRWLLGRSDSPWYPSARLFRQPATGDWGSVMSMVSEALEIWHRSLDLKKVDEVDSE